MRRQQKEEALQRAISDYERFIQDTWGPQGKASPENDRATNEVVGQIRSAVEKIAGLHEDRGAAGPTFLRIDEASLLQDRNERIAGPVDVADGNDARRRRGAEGCGQKAREKRRAP